MNTGNRRGRARYRRASRCAAQHDRDSSASTPPFHPLPFSASLAASNPAARLGRITARRDRPDREELQGRSSSTPPSHQTYSNYVPFSPGHSETGRNSKGRSRLASQMSERNSSSQTACSVEGNVPASNTCTILNSTTISSIPGGDPEPRGTIHRSRPYAATHQFERMIYPRKGPLP